MIYFAQATDGGPVKIGHSADVPARLAQLEAHYGRPLALLATLPGGRREERAIHERFASARLGRTEQFRPVAEIMEFIGRPLLVSADPNAVEGMLATASTITIKGDLEWRKWVEGGAEMCLMSVATLADIAITEYLERRGYKAKRPKRLS